VKQDQEHKHRQDVAFWVALFGAIGFVVSLVKFLEAR